MKLAIADPPYPPLFSERHDLEKGTSRVTVRSRARRWYGDGTRAAADRPADFHDDAARWDDLTEHRKLLEYLVAEFDGFAIATTPDGIGAYHPLPMNAELMAWTRPHATPGGTRIHHLWEAVIVLVPEERRARDTGAMVPNVLHLGAARGVERRHGTFAGRKPPQWTRWVLSALGYDPAVDELVDMFPGSGAVSSTADGMLL